MKAAVGPVTWNFEPPRAATDAPATTAVYSPCWGGARGHGSGSIPSERTYPFPAGVRRSAATKPRHGEGQVKPAVQPATAARSVVVWPPGSQERSTTRTSAPTNTTVLARVP